MNTQIFETRTEKICIMTSTLLFIFFLIFFVSDDNLQSECKQGRIHDNPVADSWAGAVMQKPHANQKCDRQTNGPTQQVLESRVHD